jgi:two-component system cell cycle response regulator
MSTTTETNSENASKILIVDDNLAGRETLKGLLFGRGYQLAFADSGVAALEIANEIMPDLVLLDVMMPGMDGFEVCRRLRVNPKVAEVPIIMVTALDDRDSRLRGIEAGADDFVSKPFDHAELRKRVQTITRLNRYRRLLAERSRFEWVVENADDGYVMLNEADEVIYANSKARQYLSLSEYGAESFEHINFLQRVQEHYNCEPFAAWASWPERPTLEIPRYMVRPASTHSHPFWLKVDIMETTQPEMANHLIRLRDVSPKIAEQRSVWTFHGQISHKLRTPLNHLFTSLDMIGDAELECVDPDTQTFFSIAKQGAQRLKDEIQNIFQYIEVNDVIRQGTAGCYLANIDQITADICNYLELAPIELRMNGIDDPAAYEIVLSTQAMELMLWELFENAKKFHPKQSPKLEMEISAEPDGQVVLQVQDDGVHLTPTQLEMMWVPYYQAEKYFTGQVQGPGLGLSKVSSIIWGVGGQRKSFNRSPQTGIVIELKIPRKERHFSTD